jgi:hypothetical protein
MKEKNMRRRLITIVSAAGAATAPPAFAAMETGGTGGTLMIWGFFGFLALMVVSLAIPAILSFRDAMKMGKARVPESCAADGVRGKTEDSVNHEHEDGRSCR